MSKEIFYLFQNIVVKRSISQTPLIPFKFKFVNSVKSENNSQKIATKNVNNNMIPPTFFKIVQNISQTVLNDFKGDRCKNNHFQISDHQGFAEPASCVGKSKDIEKSIFEILKGILFFASINSAICSIRFFFIVEIF